MTHAEPPRVFHTILGLAKRQRWTVEANEADRQVLVRIPNQIAGTKWIEWRVGQVGREAPPRGNLSYLSQTVFFSPRGLLGFLYWYLLYPFHLMDFRGLIKSISEQSETQ